MREMNARLERIGAQVERTNARLCRMERGRPSRAAPAGDGPGPYTVTGLSGRLLLRQLEQLSWLRARVSRARGTRMIARARLRAGI
jgi:hypothetical protein